MFRYVRMFTFLSEPDSPSRSSLIHTATRLGAAILIGASAAITFPGPSGSVLHAQGVTTAAVGGTVRATDGSDVDGTRVTVVNTATGVVAQSEVRHGRFLVSGLKIGGPYTVIVQRIGFQPQRREKVYLSLGERLELEVVMRPVAVPLDTLRVRLKDSLPRVNAAGGTGTTLTEPILHRLPSLNRDLHDFVRLVPQVSTKVGLALGGVSGGGVGLRFNNFLVNGASERSVSGNMPPNIAGGKSVPLGAVKEYQVLLAPYDVRYGDFAGTLVNTVTESGTNELRGSAFGYWRNDHLGRDGGRTSIPPYERWQYGFSLGGPILHDRLHFFVAPELQHFTSPAPGPYVGQPPGSRLPVPVSERDLARLDEIMGGYGLIAGSGGPVENSNHLLNVFGRLDLALPEWSSRAVLWENYARTRDLSFSRDGPTFPLSSHKATQAFQVWTTAFQLHSRLGRGGGHNELLVSHNAARAEFLADVQQPVVRVSVPSTADGSVTITTGTPVAAQEAFFDTWKLHVKDNLTLPLSAAHVATFGLEAERFRVDRNSVFGSYGTWTFSSLDSLERGLAERFEIRRDFGSGSVPISGGQYAVYAGDRWQAAEGLAITLGLRADLLDIGGDAPLNPLVDSIFGRRTNAMPKPRVHLSPRFGFEWDVSGAERDLLRGGAGIFTGRPPVAWIHSALSNYGTGIGVLRCGSLPTDAGRPPPFEPDYRAAPTACEDGSDLTASPDGAVNLVDRDLRMARTLRASVAYDRRFPGELFATVEALITRTLSDYVFVNLNLEGPKGADRHGRVLYGGPVGPEGLVAPAAHSDFAEVIDLQNTSRNHAYQLSARLEKRFARSSRVAASYTYSRVRDIQTPVRVNVPWTVNWSSRAVSGLHDALSRGISGNDIPHRVVLTGAVAAPWKRWSTLVSFYYVGESGRPFTYRAWGRGRRGDLNADGSDLNDPIYVPRDAFDPHEITFSGHSERAGADDSPSARAERVSRQQAALERFIHRSPCLRRQRGRILGRNSCREPWSHTTILSVRQAIPVAAGALDVELDLFNVLNLLDREWGLFRVAKPALLEHVGQTPDGEQPVFRFDTTRRRWTTLPTKSAFQLQFALRYRF